MIYFDLCLSSITCLNALSLELSPIQSDFERVVPQWPNEVHAKGIFLNILKKYQLSSQSWDSSSYNSSVFCPPAMLLRLPFPSTDNTPNWWKKVPSVNDENNICELWAYKHCQRTNGPRHCLNCTFIITQSRQCLGAKRLHRKRMSKPNPHKCIFNKQSQFRSTLEACNFDKSFARYPD